jgi:predicted Zn-dependent peptidase
MSFTGHFIELLNQPAAPILAARLIIPFGSIYDPIGLRGRQQLLAGVLTRGCGNLTAEQFANQVESIGAILRCDAGEDLLIICLKCNIKDASILLPLLFQMIEAPRCDKIQVDLERDLNLQTIHRLQEDPFHLCHENLRPLLYGNGPYGHDPVGLKSDLKNINYDEIKKTSQQLPSSNAMLVLVGDPKIKLVEQCQSSIANWLHQPEALPQLHPEPDINFAAAPCDTGQVVLMLGFRTVGIRSSDAILLRILQVHLGVGMSCRLFQVMREERGLAYDVGVEFMSRNSDAPFIWHLSSGVERAQEALTALLGEWQQLLQVPLTSNELDLAIAKMRGQEALSRETPSQRADRLALLLSYGLPKNHNELCLERIKQVSPLELQEVARRWLHKPKLSVCGPAEALKGLERQWRIAGS